MPPSPMRKVTDIFERYRECARHLRNTYFSTIESKDWETIKDFEAVDDVLFERMVFSKLEDVRSPRLSKARMSELLRLIPSSQHGVPVMISRDKGQTSGAWDNPIDRLTPEDAEIAFTGYFDWDSHALIDLRYYRGQILSSKKYPAIVGHALFIETQYAEVHYIPEQPEV